MKMDNSYKLWTSPYNRAQQYAKKYPDTKYIFQHPNSIWLTGKQKPNKVVSSISRILTLAGSDNPTFVIYAIPNRDLGNHSAGGLTPNTYIHYIKQIAYAIGDKTPIIIFEPDATPHLGSMGGLEQMARISLMKEAIDILATTNARIYIDVGHSNWISVDVVTSYLSLLPQKFTGVAINVSNYRTTDESARFGEAIAAKYNYQITYVVDTSRNGLGPLDNAWCNPPGRAIGELPTTQTHYENADAYLWIKVPGESDGKCCGGPIAGKFWPEEAEGLVQRSKFIKRL